MKVDYQEINFAITIGVLIFSFAQVWIWESFSYPEDTTDDSKNKLSYIGFLINMILFIVSAWLNDKSQLIMFVVIVVINSIILFPWLIWYLIMILEKYKSSRYYPGNNI